MASMNTTDQQHRIRELEATCATCITEIARLEFKIGELNGEIAHLQTELRQRQGTRQKAHDLYRAVDDAIIHRIDKRGYNRAQPRYKKIVIATKPEDFGSLGQEDLMQLASDYDARTYFHLHSLKSDMRLQYRALSKAYRVVRDTAVFGAKKSYHVARRIAR
jgi:uncharacterized small protein (DUF1192 family)